MKVLPDVFTAKVVGMSFVDGYPHNIVALGETNDRVLDLRHNPSNEFDDNAIEVWRADSMIGHLPRAAAARVATEIRDGVAWQAQVIEVLIDPNHTDNPGLLIRCERKDNG